MRLYLTLYMLINIKCLIKPYFCISLNFDFKNQPTFCFCNNSFKKSAYNF